MVTEQEGWGSQLRKGVLELAVLGLLAREPMYGSQLVDELAARPELSITAGTVYPLVARLAKGGLVTSTWQESPVGPPRKYYKLTTAGTRALSAMATTFTAVATAIREIVEESR
jgi:PadR family transcriptional regulator, regulatory protein PadR